MRKIFLAGPYGHADREVVDRRFNEANAVAAKIARSGSTVFSQISMSHPINGHLSDLDKAAIGKLWAPIDQVFMEAMDEIVVIDGPGWQESAGVKREMEFFESKGRRVSLWSDVEHEFA
ncbi:DUF1937 family protein [Mesorhizobium sp. 1M-11]|uniref:DUF1937 family protein n=1 Tax=Mesorhizobium sp. 1M-11 TaxID=1529006 RepID=UPI0006C760AB|nr:DUF1937 family protein [Mesorhizobium sp. 1M-11]